MPGISVILAPHSQTTGTAPLAPTALKALNSQFPAALEASALLEGKGRQQTASSAQLGTPAAVRMCWAYRVGKENHPHSFVSDSFGYSENKLRAPHHFQPVVVSSTKQKCPQIILIPKLLLCSLEQPQVMQNSSNLLCTSCACLTWLWPCREMNIPGRELLGWP